jgi:hypothetical protein
MSVMLLTPFTMVNRRSAPMGGITATYNPSGNYLTGRWALINASGEAVVPGIGHVKGAYLVLEGNLGHNGDPTDFGADTTGYASTSSFELPSVQQSGELALAYGAFRYQTGPEGCDPTQSFTVDGYVTLDGYGRIVPAGSAGVATGKVESVTTGVFNGSSLVTELVVRTFGF